MPEKKKIVIASLLKPIDDNRMYKKMGHSLARAGHRVTIIGYPTMHQVSDPHITFCPLKSFSRIGLKRIMAPWQVLRKIVHKKPDILLINTYELLIVSIVYKWLYRRLILYDVRENYYRNIRYSESFPPVLCKVLACYVRGIEILTAPFFSLFILAEKSYRNEMFFFNDRYIVIENKALPPTPYPKKKTGKTALLFTGTVATSTGIFRALLLAKELHHLDSNITLTIIGQCVIKKTMNRLLEEIKNEPYISLTVNEHPTPHAVLLKAIEKAHFGIICYPPSPSTQNSMPTKLYEYMAAQLPILVWDDQSFIPYITDNHAGIIVSKPYQTLLSSMQQQLYYDQPASALCWEEKAFCDAIQRV